MLLNKSLWCFLKFCFSLARSVLHTKPAQSGGELKGVGGFLNTTLRNFHQWLKRNKSFFSRIWLGRCLVRVQSLEGINGLILEFKQRFKAELFLGFSKQPLKNLVDKHIWTSITSHYITHEVLPLNTLWSSIIISNRLIYLRHPLYHLTLFNFDLYLTQCDKPLRGETWK